MLAALRHPSEFLFGSALLLACFLQRAEAGSAHGVGVSAAGGGDANRIGVHWDVTLLDDTWHRKRYTLAVEFGLSRWNSDNDAWQISGVPFLRLWLSGRLFVEAGIGASFFSESEVGGRQLGTAFQFCDHLGIGVQVSAKDRLSLRFSHFSNGGIAHPNDGLDVLQLTYTRSQ